MLYAVLKSLFFVAWIQERKTWPYDIDWLFYSFTRYTGQRYKLSTLNIELPILK